MANQLQPLPASGLSVPRANILLADVGTQAFTDVGDCENFTMSLEVEEIERYGKNFSTKTLRKSDVIQVNATISFEVVDFTKFIRSLSVGADDKGRFTQNAATAETKTFASVAPGKVYKVDHMGISSVTVSDGSGLVEYIQGVHVIVLNDTGYIQVLVKPEGADADMVVEYSAPAIVADDEKVMAGIASNMNIRKTIHVIGIGAIGQRDLLVLHDVQMRPEGDRAFVGEDDYATLTITGRVFADVSKAEGLQLGHLITI